MTNFLEFYVVGFAFCGFDCDTFVDFFEHAIEINNFKFMLLLMQIVLQKLLKL